MNLRHMVGIQEPARHNWLLARQDQEFLNNHEDS